MPKKKIEKQEFLFNKNFKGDEVIIGIDSSLKHTAVVVINTNKEILYRESIVQESNGYTRQKVRYNVEDFVFYANGQRLDKIVNLITDNQINELKRLKVIRDRVISICKKLKVTHACIENRANHGKGRVLELSSLILMIRVGLYEMGIKDYAISPKTLKGYITNNGSAEKEEVQEALSDRYGIYLEDDNEADAYSLAVTLCELGEEINILSNRKLGGLEQYRKQKYGKKKG